MHKEAMAVLNSIDNLDLPNFFDAELPVLYAIRGFALEAMGAEFK
jgi:hypothetical protein